MIRLRGVEAWGYHGLLPSEQSEGQIFRVDADLSVNLERCGASDDIADTVNYAQAATDIHGLITGPARGTIESLAHAIATKLLSGYRAVESVRVEVHKPQAPIPVPFGDVSVEVELRRRRCVLSLGSNLPAPGLQHGLGDLADGGNAHPTVVGAAGTPAVNLLAGAYALNNLEYFRLCAGSPVYVTKPVLAPGQEEQPDYWNGVVIGELTTSPWQLLEGIHEIEARAGRKRGPRWGSRTLDIDIIAVEGFEHVSERLTVPHPRAHERAFVLVPWSELQKDAELGGVEVSELARTAPDRPDTVLAPPTMQVLGWGLARGGNEYAAELFEAANITTVSTDGEGFAASAGPGCGGA